MDSIKALRWIKYFSLLPQLFLQCRPVSWVALLRILLGRSLALTSDRTWSLRLWVQNFALIINADYFQHLIEPPRLCLVFFLTPHQLSWFKDSSWTVQYPSKYLPYLWYQIFPTISFVAIPILGTSLIVLNSIDL